MQQDHLNKTALGQEGEAAVAAFLKNEGYVILEANYRQRCGEVDLIAARNEILCFVEVKTRQKEYFSTSQVVTSSKQKRIIRTAQYYILKNRIKNKAFRFDVAIVIHKSDQPEIRYIANAFNTTAMSHG